MNLIGVSFFQYSILIHTFYHYSCFYKERKEKIDNVAKKKIEATASLLKKINPILADYSKKNGISIIFRKKDIVLARSNLEITAQIIELVNSKVKKININ